MHFWEEFEALRRQTPRLGTTAMRAINSAYTSATDRCSHSYFLFNAIASERSLYSENLYECVECVDCTHMSFSARCYECVDGYKCQDCEFVQLASHCRNLRYCYDMQNCTNCVGCVGLRDKDFYIFNKPYTAADYFIKLRSLSSRQIQENFACLLARTPRPALMNHVYESEKTAWGFDVVRAKNSSYIYDGADITNSVDCTVIQKSSECYEVTDGSDLKNCSNCFMCARSNDLEYGEFVFDSSFCFGCVGLKGKQYYILNKPYSRDEYFKTVAQIKSVLRSRL